MLRCSLSAIDYPLQYSVARPSGINNLLQRAPKTAGVDEQVLKRVVRITITLGVFAEPSSGIVAHTALSAVFVRELIMRSWTKFCSEDTAISAVRLLEALQPNPQRSAFQVAYGTEKNYFQWIGDKLVHVKAFAGSMEMLGRSAPYSADHLVNGSDFERPK